MALSLLSGCAGSKPSETTSPDKVEGTMEELLNEIVAQQPVEFDGGVETIDLTDTSEEGQWAIKSSTGLDNAGVQDIRALLLELKAQGKTILLASHNHEDIAALCDTVHEMDGGVLL